MNSALKSIRTGLCAASLASIVTANLWADTIYLKNGRRIEATNIVREDGKLSFDTDGGTVSLSESMVERIVSDHPGSAVKPAAESAVRPATTTSVRPTVSASPSAAPAVETPKAKAEPVRASPELVATKPEPVGYKVQTPTPTMPAMPTVRQQRKARQFTARPFPHPKPKAFAVANASAPNVEEALLNSQVDLAHLLAAAPREAKTWFLSEASARPGFGDAERAKAAAPPAKRTPDVHVGTFAAAVKPEPGSAAGNGVGSGDARTVQASGFPSLEVVAAPRVENEEARSGEAPVESVIVLSEPNPAYTEEARQLGIEGEVLVDLVFLASGQVKVKGIVKGLGHGLDDASIRAAQEMRFKPASQGGRAVDYPATLHIEFKLPL